MTPATWWALAFIAACVLFIVWVRWKYPISETANPRRATRRRPRAQKVNASKTSGKLRAKR